MKRIVSMKMNGDILQLYTRVYVDARIEDKALAKQLICDGIARIGEQGPYAIGEKRVEVSSSTEFTERFALDAVNVRVEDVAAARRQGILRIFNTVSRAYMGARFRGLYKFARRLLHFPDVFINLAGRDITQSAQYALECSVVAHEFAHVWGCADQYKYKNDEKRSPSVAADDLMYRTGASQRMQPYHIERFCMCAKKGKLPVRRIV